MVDYSCFNGGDFNSEQEFNFNTVKSFLSWLNDNI